MDTGRARERPPPGAPREGGPDLRSIFDAAWRARALEGHADAISALTTDALPPLYRFCLYRVGRNAHLCEEVVQETLLRALRELRQYDPGRAANNIFPWL